MNNNSRLMTIPPLNFHKSAPDHLEASENDLFSFILCVCDGGLFWMELIVLRCVRCDFALHPRWVVVRVERRKAMRDLVFQWPKENSNYLRRRLECNTILILASSSRTVHGHCWIKYNLYHTEALQNFMMSRPV